MLRLRLVLFALAALAALALGAPAADPKGSAEAPAPVVVKFTIDGRAWSARVPDKQSLDAWLNGPLVSETRTVVRPLDSAGKPHPFLRVVADVRRFKEGGRRVDLAVENVTDTPEAGPVTYDVAISAGKKELFAHKGLNHYYLSRWRKTFLLDGLTATTAFPASELYYRTNALPRYLSTVTNKVDKMDPAKFGPMQIGDLNTDMTTGGGHPYVAPYPDWTARFLVHHNPEEYAYTLANGTLGGTWPVHVRNPDGTLVRVDKEPRYWIDSRWSPYSKGPRGAEKLTKPYKGTLIPDNAHQPSLAYVPYLLTGDRYYADEMSFWTEFGILASLPAEDDKNNNNRRGAKGLIGQNQTRGVAWVLRNVADAAAYLPDNDPYKKYLAQVLVNNLHWLDERAEKPGPLGVDWHAVDEREYGKPFRSVSTWTHHYLAWAIDHANKQGFKGGTKWRDQQVKLQLKMFNSPDYPREHAAPYRLAIGEYKDGNNIVLFRDLKEAYAGNKEFGRGFAPFQGNYGVNARLMLLIAEEEGLPKAKESLDYLDKIIANDLRSRAGWAIAPPGKQPTPKALTVQLSGRGWATFGVTLEKGKAKSAVQVGNLTTQTDVKCRWPDGSVKFAIVTCKADRAGRFELTTK